MEFLKSQGKITLLSIVVFVIMSIIMFKLIMPKSEYHIEEKYLKSSKEKNFNGVIEEKFIETNNHNRAFILLNNNTKINLANKLYTKLEINDSIIKLKDNLFVIIHRNGITYKIDYFTGEIIDYR